MPRVTAPREGEPIRLVQTKTGVRYRAVLDVSPKGAPRRQVTTTHDTLAEARAWVTETRQRLADGNYTAPQKVTLRTLAADWLASKRDVRTVTREGYKTALTTPLDRLGDRPAQSITRRDVDALMEALETEGGRRGRPLSHRSQVLILQTLRQVLAYGVSVGVLNSNPASEVKARRARKGDRKETAVWSVDDLRSFVSHVDAQADDWVKVGGRLTASGLRRSEVLGLAWSSVDLEAGTIRVEASRVRTGNGYDTERDEAKSAASVRDVPVEVIWPGTVAALRSLKARQAADRLAAGPAYDDSGLVLVDALGRGIHPEVYAQRWRGLRRAAGLPEIRLHAMRHTLATMLHGAGVAPADAAALLGHELMTHMTFYVQRTDTGAATAAAALGRIVAAQ